MLANEPGDDLRGMDVRRVDVRRVRLFITTLLAWVSTEPIYDAPAGLAADHPVSRQSHNANAVASRPGDLAGAGTDTNPAVC